MYKANSGVDDPSLLADDFRFEFPVVSLAKQAGFRLLSHISKAYSCPAQWKVSCLPSALTYHARNPSTPVQEL